MIRALAGVSFLIFLSGGMTFLIRNITSREKRYNRENSWNCSGIPLPYIISTLLKT